MKTSMLKSTLCATVVLALLGNSAQAADQITGKYEEQRVGTGLGMVIGTALGGPIGLVVAGYIGNKIGESKGEGKELVQLHQAVDHSEQALALSKAEHAQQLALAQHKLQTLQQQLVAKQAQYEQQMAALEKRTAMENSLAVSLQFRTGSNEIEPVYQQQLIELAQAMNNLQQYSLDLSGYADRQGDEQYNQQLSASRAEAVKQFLISQGVAPTRIVTKAFGESQPLNPVQTAQSDFFDRRVMLKLSPTGQAVAKN